LCDYLSLSLSLSLSFVLQVSLTLTFCLFVLGYINIQAKSITNSNKSQKQSDTKNSPAWNEDIKVLVKKIEEDQPGVDEINGAVLILKVRDGTI
jgi:hypothetical protein